jgi:predicted MFS family arabinose efflux permease
MGYVFVTNYLQLVCARVAAAVGEAGCKPPTYTLVGDYFPEPADRTRALAIYVTASSIASLLSFAIGGWLTQRYGWRVAFFIMGIPGLVLALVVRCTVSEPRSHEGVAKSGKRLPPMREVLVALWRLPALRHLTAALVLLYMIGQGLGPWYAAVMIRSHHMSTTELGLSLGLIFGLSGLTGVLAGGSIAARWFPNNERGQMRMSALTVSATVPFFLGFLLLPKSQYALASLVPLFVAFNVFLGPTYALMQRLVTSEMRATTLAVVMLLANLIGMGIGPQVVGILSDALTPKLGPDALRYAMLIMSLVAFWASYHFWCVGRTIKQDLTRACVAEIDQRSPAISERRVSAH